MAQPSLKHPPNNEKLSFHTHLKVAPQSLNHHSAITHTLSLSLSHTHTHTYKKKTKKNQKTTTTSTNTNTLPPPSLKITVYALPLTFTHSPLLTHSLTHSLAITVYALVHLECAWRGAANTTPQQMAGWGRRWWSGRHTLQCRFDVRS